MKIGFASRWDPLDKRSWSGTNHFTYKEISKRYETEIYQYRWTWVLREWLTMQKSMNRRVFGKSTSVEFLRSYSKFFSRKLERDLEKRPVDCLFVCASSQLLAYLDTKIPIIYMTDASFAQLQGYYPGFSNLPKYNIRQGIELDKKAFRKTAHCMLASEWNRQSVIRDYGIDPDKLSVVPCGANLDQVPAQGTLHLKAGERCNLLFLGVEWERKGGGIVLDTFKLLQAQGLDPELKIIGCTPPVDLSGSGSITVIPFLDKNKPEDLSKLQQIFLDTDILFLPTRAECAGVVFSEASAYGIPSVTTNTGGVSTYVRDGINGYALAYEATPGEYANLIRDLVRDPKRLSLLKQASRRFYEENLNWDLWGERFSAIVGNLVPGR